MNRRDRRKGQTRASLLAAAMQQFVKQGIYTTRVEDITEGADVAKGAFYNYFESKNDIVAELLFEGIGLLEESYLKNVEQILPASKRIELLVEKHEAFWLDHPEFRLLFHQSRGILLLEPDASPKLKEALRRYLECLAHKLTDWQKTEAENRERTMHLAAALAGLIAGYWSFAQAAGLTAMVQLPLQIARDGLIKVERPAFEPD